MDTKQKLPKAPVKPTFNLGKPVPPKGAQVVGTIWEFDNENLDCTNLNWLNRKIEEYIETHGITGDYNVSFHQTYASSEYGHCEFELRISYYNNNPTTAQLKSYEKLVDAYNNAKLKYDADLAKYEADKALYDKEVAEMQRQQELELLNQLIKKHGIPQSVTKE